MRKALIPLFACALPGFLGFICGCGSARRGAPLVGPLRLEEPELVTGREVFSMNCHQCHPGGEGGLGPALNNKPLPDFLIRLQVRQGLGAMPAFSEDEISEREMEALLGYMEALRKHGPEAPPLKQAGLRGTTAAR